MLMTQNPLIMFYLGSHPDGSGRLLSDVLAQDDFWLESCHDYIQWLFPNKAYSRVTPDAPTVTDEVKQAFLSDELLRDHLMASFHRMLSFYGLEHTKEEIVKADNWEERKGNWFTQETHNNLRITRILKCLATLGLKSEAVEFYNVLTKLEVTENDCGIGSRAYEFWREAVNE